MILDYPERKGKYLRPTVLTLTALSLGAEIDECLNTAAAMQISEDWLLIHDDFEDQSQERRGKPTLHKIYGNELSVNAGNALHLVMWEALIDNFSVLDQKRSIQILTEFQRMLTRTAIGQTSELILTLGKKIDIRDEDYYFIIDGKTSYYSVAGPLRLGATIAKADQAKIDILTDFGRNLGRAYQIVDDVLDLTSTFSGLKKQTGNDIYENKRTIILGHLMRNIKGEDKEKAIQIMLKKRDEKIPSEVDWIISKMHSVGSIQYAMEKARKFTTIATKILDEKLGFLKKPYVDDLRVLTEFILERKH